MDRTPEWRAVEPAAPDGRAEPMPGQGQGPAANGWRLIVVAALGLAALAGTGLALAAATPSGGLLLEPGAVTAIASEAPSSAPDATGALEPELMIDVQGAVERPGLYRLPAGSRVGDAIGAAGGYSLSVDLELAALRINLAERLADGAKVHVPRRGEQPAMPLASEPPSTGGGGPSGGPIDVNAADQRTLETLPGIGPVTAAKIIAAREETPFASIDDLLGRKVVGPATFEKIRGLISTGP
jgi:competence protein ComEA